VCWCGGLGCGGCRSFGRRRSADDKKYLEYNGGVSSEWSRGGARMAASERVLGAMRVDLVGRGLAVDGRGAAGLLDMSGERW
jgi:hypothetical protein